MLMLHKQDASRKQRRGPYGTKIIIMCRADNEAFLWEGLPLAS